MPASYSYTGATTISGGTLVLDNSSNQTLSGGINGPGTLVQLGPGMTTLSGTGSLTGNIIITGGTLQDTNFENTGNPTTSGLGNPQTAGRTVTINHGGTLCLRRPATRWAGGSTTPALALVINAGGRVISTGGAQTATTSWGP